MRRASSSSAYGSRLVFAVAAMALTVALWASAVLAGPTCGGDCDASGQVTVEEVVRAVDILLGSLPISECFVADLNGDGFVHIAEVVGSLTNSIAGCPPP